MADFFVRRILRGLMFNRGGGKVMDSNLFDLGDLDSVLQEFNESTEGEEELSDEMKESQRRYDEYIKKHKNDR